MSFSLEDVVAQVPLADYQVLQASFVPSTLPDSSY